MSKCIKCGRELTSAEIPEFYNGMCEKCCKELNCAEYPFKQGINDYQNQIDQLKQQLAEKDKLLKCYQEEEKLIADILGDKDLTIIGSRAHLKNLIVELKNKIKDKDIVIEEKDKEIERLNHKLNVEEPCLIRNYKDMLEQLTQEIDNLNAKVTQMEEQDMVFHNQLAISELEKVKMLTEWKFNSIIDVVDYIDQQIKKLKGE